MADRLRFADKIVYLDYSGLLCLFRTLKRWFMHKRVSRSEMPKEALERFDPKFLWVVAMRKERPGIESALKGIDRGKVFRISSPRKLKKFFN